MVPALLIITIGGIMVYSALTGTPIVDVVAGRKSGNPLDSKGGNTVKFSDGTQSPDLSTPTISGTPPSSGGNGKFPSGPNAALLTELSGIAVSRFHLRIGSTTGGNHVPGSYHYQGRAFDADGSEADMRAFAQFVFAQYGTRIAELIHNPGPAIKDGKSVSGPIVYAAVWLGHRNHVHVAA